EEGGPGGCRRRPTLRSDPGFHAWGPAPILILILADFGEDELGKPYRPAELISYKPRRRGHREPAEREAFRAPLRLPSAVAVLQGLPRPAPRSRSGDHEAERQRAHDADGRNERARTALPELAPFAPDRGLARVEPALDLENLGVDALHSPGSLGGSPRSWRSS